MPRRTFERLYTEICVAVNARISRYALWLCVWESGADPDDMTQQQAHSVVENQLSPLLREEGLHLDARGHKRLARRILRFNPAYPTPEEWLTI